MIKKFGSVRANRARVEALFFDVRTWPEWMPGLRSVRVVEERPGFARVDCLQTFAGRDRPAELAIETSTHTVRQRLLRGWARRLDFTFRFLERPHSDDTTVALEAEIDLGMVGLLLPAAVVEQSVDRTFRGILRGLEGRLGPAEPSALRAHAPETAEILLQIFRTADGLELSVGGRTFRL